MDEHINESFHAVVDDIRTRSSEELLDENLTEVWLKKGYSRESVLQYIDSLLGDFKYQKAALSATIRDLSDQKKTLALEKEVLAKQLSESRNLENAYIVEAEDKLSHLSAKNLDLQEENNDLRAKIAEGNQVRSQLTAQNKELVQYESELQHKIEGLADTNEKLEAELEVLHKQVNKKGSLTSENARLQDELNKLSEEYRVCAADRDELIGELEVAGRQIEELIDATEDTVDVLNRAQTVQSEVIALQKKFGIEPRAITFDKKYEGPEIRGRNSKLVQLLDGSVAALETLLQTTHHIQEEKNALEIEVTKSTAEANSAKSTIVILDDELNTCKDELSAANQALDDLGRDYKQAIADLEKAKEISNSLKEDNDNSRLMIESQNKAFELIERVVTSITQATEATSVKDITSEVQTDLLSAMNFDMATSVKTLISQINAEIDES